MEMFSFVMTACSTFISVYTLLIIIHIMLSWFAGTYGQGKIAYILARITGPYLEFFRRFRFLRVGLFDFSPVLALITLYVAGNVFLSLAAFRQITFGFVLALFISRLWAAAAFFLVMYIFLAALRLVGLLARLSSASPFWRYVDMILNPVLRPFARLVFRGRNVPYMSGLVAGGLLLLAVRFLGAILIERLVILAQKIPF
jgi:YggT family protein